jgi:hypothetical protein
VGEVRVALWLSLACAVTAALLAVPAGSAEFLLNDQVWETFGNGLDYEAVFRNTTRMQLLEPFTVEFNLSTPNSRLQRVLALVWSRAVLLLFFPACYVAYLGASVNVLCLTLGGAVLTLVVSAAGYVLFDITAFINYNAVLGFVLLIVALKLICPGNSRIPTQAIKQMLVITLGNVLVVNVFQERSVSRAARVAFASC